MVGEEVRRVHPVLAVGEFRNLRYESACPFGIDDRELHLDEGLRHVDPAPPRSMNRRRGLTAVHDLEVLEAAQQQPAPVVFDLDLLGRGGDAVVVREEHGGLVFEGDPDPLVDLPAMLQEDPHVLFQKPDAPSVVYCRQHLPGNDRQVRFQIGFRLPRGKYGERFAEFFRQVDVDFFPAVSRRRLPVQPPDVPHAEGDRPAVELVRFPTVDPFTQLAIGDQEQAHPADVVPAS